MILTFFIMLTSAKIKNSDISAIEISKKAINSAIGSTNETETPTKLERIYLFIYLFIYFIYQPKSKTVMLPMIGL